MCWTGLWKAAGAELCRNVGLLVLINLLDPDPTGFLTGAGRRSWKYGIT